MEAKPKFVCVPKSEFDKLISGYKEMKIKLQEYNQERNELARIVSKGLIKEKKYCRRIWSLKKFSNNLQERVDETVEQKNMLLQKINALTEELNNLKCAIKLQKEELNLQSDESVPRIPRRRTPQEEKITNVIFGSPVRRRTAVDEFPCRHSCVLHSFVHTCRQQNIAICIPLLIKKAAYSAYPKQLLDCKNTANLLTKFGVIRRVAREENMLNLEMLDETFPRVTQNVKGNFGLLVFGYDDRDIGHCVCFEKVGNKLLIWDPQKNEWWSEDDYSHIIKVSCYEVNTDHVKSLSSTCDCL